MDRGILILELMDELRNMPEYELYNQLSSFSVSIYTFDKNYQELKNLIIFLSSDPRAESLYWLRNRDKLNKVMIEIIRLIHNYVAASLSLIDHTRRLYKNLYADNGSFPEYQIRINEEFVNDPLAQFVKCLRQYCQHYQAPDLDFTTKVISGGKEIIRTVNLLKSDLLTFNGWSSKARLFLKNVDGKVDVLAMSTQYNEKIINFYRWFQSRQQEIHSNDLKRFEHKENQLLLLTLEGKIDVSFAQSHQGIPHTKDELFTSIFTSVEFDELEKISRESSERPARAIELLEERFFPISNQMKQRIFLLYQLPDLIPNNSENLQN